MLVICMAGTVASAFLVLIFKCYLLCLRLSCLWEVFFIYTLEIKNLYMEYGAKTLFQIEELDVYTEDKIGIVGPNGAGKTTLLEIICGRIEASAGYVDLKVSHVYVPQLTEEDGVISELSGSEWKVPDEANSGGEITRRKLAKAFSTSSQMLLCDEPTSNLDEEGINQLEQSLLSYKGSIIMVSHDRALLDKVCNKIWEIEDGELTEYHGNYSSYKTQKELKRKNAWDEYEKYTLQKRHLEEASRNRSSKASGMKNPPKRMGNSEARLHRQSVRQSQGKVQQAAKQIKRRLEHLEKVDKPKEEISFKMRANISNEYVSKTAVTLDRLSFSYGRKEVLKDISLMVKRGEKVSFTGKNGSGKSTLLNCIYKEHTGVRVANGASVGYFRQDLNNLKDNETILQSIKKESSLPEHMIRSVLGRLGIRRDDVFKKIEVLSGGERCKVSLAKIICGGYSIILLDEPTNYLDIYVLEALEEMLKSFDGTLLLVSHDRYFRKKVTDKQLTIENKSLHSDIKPQKAKPIKQNIMILEMQKADLVSRMTFPKKGDVRQELEEQYNEVCRRLKSFNL